MFLQLLEKQRLHVEDKTLLCQNMANFTTGQI
jgi:hypothetical protein